MKKFSLNIIIITLIIGLVSGFTSINYQRTDTERKISERKMPNLTSTPKERKQNQQSKNTSKNKYSNHTEGTPFYVDNFDGENDTLSLKERGYKVYYRGSGPQGITATWFQGISLIFSAYNGLSTGYLAANFNVATNVNNIDSWIILPKNNVYSGDSICFFSRSIENSIRPDSIRVMYSAQGDSIPETGSWIELGRFKVNTLGEWERKGFKAISAGNKARFAIRYSIVNSGPNGVNGSYIGIDMLTIERTDESIIPTTINLTAAVQALLNSQSNTLLRKDTIYAYLRDTVSPYVIRSQSVALIDSQNLTGSFSFFELPESGRYYIVLRYKNGIETWSRNGGELINRGQIFNYDFTSGSDKAFGGNLILRGTKYCIYSGDINQDGFIDVTDGSIIDNDVFHYASGFINSDLNGDGFADISDFVFVDNNSFNYVNEITLRPPGYFVTYRNETVNIPNSKIVSDGIVFNNEAIISPNRLIGIIKDTDAYLYFTGDSDADLNEETSRKSIGRFLADTSSDISENIELPTGLDVTEFGSQFKFSNSKRRWAAINTRINNRDSVVYLAQRGDLLDINIVRALDGDVIKILQNDYITLPIISEVKTYGASIRLINNSSAWNILYHKNQDALASGANTRILAIVNIVDYMHYFIEGVLSLTGIIDPPLFGCIKSLVLELLTDTFMSAVTILLTHTDSRDEFKSILGNAINNFFICAAPYLLGPTGAVIEKFIDIYAAVHWILFDNFVSYIDITGNATFDKWNPYPNATEGMVAFYPFNGNSDDESGNGNNGTNFEATLSTDRFNNPNSAYYFNGTSSYIKVNQHSTLEFGTGDFTVCAWIQTTGDHARVVSKGECFSTGWVLGHDSRIQIQLQYRPGNVLIYPTSNNSGYNNGDWHFILLKRQNGLIYIYGDGELVSNSISFPYNLSNTLEYLTIGRCRESNGQCDNAFFNGKIDDIRIFNRSLNNDEISQLYHVNNWP